MSGDGNFNFNVNPSVNGDNLADRTNTMSIGLGVSRCPSPQARICARQSRMMVVNRSFRLRQCLSPTSSRWYPHLRNGMQFRQWITHHQEVVSKVTL
jgi:hypothetical protein